MCSLPVSLVPVLFHGQGQPGKVSSKAYVLLNANEGHASLTSMSWAFQSCVPLLVTCLSKQTDSGKIRRA